MRRILGVYSNFYKNYGASLEVEYTSLLQNAYKRRMWCLNNHFNIWNNNCAEKNIQHCVWNVYVWVCGFMCVCVTECVRLFSISKWCFSVKRVNIHLLKINWRNNIESRKRFLPCFIRNIKMYESQEVAIKNSKVKQVCEFLKCECGKN